MTEKQLNLAAAKAGFKSGELRAEFRRGHAAAETGIARDAHHLPETEKTRIAAFEAGFDLFAPEPQLGEHVVTIAEREFPVILNRAEQGEGYEVTVPIAGGTSVVFGRTPQAALDAARDRLKAAAHEFAEQRPDPIVEAFGRDGNYGETTFSITVNKRKSGRYDFVCADYPDVTHSAGDEETGFAEFVGKLSMARDLAQAQTVDGQRAKVVNGKPTPQQTLPIRTPAECAVEVHRCMTKLADREAEEETAKNKRKAAETALASAYRALLEATDRESKPALPLETAAAAP